MTTDPFTQHEPQLATEDILIERPDLGPGCYTLVVGGTPIPSHLAALQAATEKTNENKRSKRT